MAAVFGRQVVDAAASPDAVFREARYPATSFAIELGPDRVLDLARMPISNASAAYRVPALRAVGGFQEDLLASEDIGAAVSLLDAGHAVWYAGDSRVFHSHRYDFVSQIRRTFDMATSQRQLCGKLRLRMPGIGGYLPLLRSLSRARRHTSWRGRLALGADLGARAVGVVLARLSPLMPRPMLRRVSAQRWFYAHSATSTSVDRVP